MRTKLVVYGERPITEFIVLLSKEPDIVGLLGNIQFLDGKQLDFKEPLDKVYLEAPLGKKIGYIDMLFIFRSFCIFCEIKPECYENVKGRLENQIPRYYDYVQTLESSSNAVPLVRAVIKDIEGKERYLVCMTKDIQFPTSFKELINGQKGDKNRIGWLAYKHFKKIGDKYGFSINGEGSHIWMEYRK